MRTKLIPLFACALALMALQQCSTNKATDEFIERPFANIALKNNIFELDASEAKTFKLANGSSISVPANAFVDENGNPIKGKVKIDYREFHDAADIIASGIPMSYDSAGVKGDFETAGMFEIQGATVDGKPVFIAPGKKLDVNIASFNNNGNFNNYFLNPTTRNWEFTGTARTITNEDKQARMKAIPEAPAKPMKPEEYDGKSPVFDLDLNYKHYPQLKEFNGVVWQYVGDDASKDPAKNPSIFKRNWTYVDLKQVNDSAATFELQLSNGSNSFTTTIKPVLSGKNYKEAMDKFQSRISKYNSAVAARKKEEARLAVEGDVLRSFSVMGFGVYNCDRIYKREDNVLVYARIIFDGKNENNSALSIYHVAANNKAIIKLPVGDNPTLAVSLSEGDNKLIAVLPDNRLAVCGSGEFENLNLERGKTETITGEFHMKVKEQKISNVEDIRKILDSL